MKKIFLLVVLFSFLSTSNIFAQGITAKGIVAGLNLSNVSGEDITNNSIKLGFAIGGFVTYSINNKIAVRPEIYYSTKGFNTEFFETDVAISFNYIDIPILGVFSINRNIHAFAGPYIDIFLNGKFTNSKTNESEDIESENITSPGFGLTLGAEYMLQQFSIGARFSLGLSNVPDDEDAKYKHSDIQIMVGYYIP